MSKRGLGWGPCLFEGCRGGPSGGGMANVAVKCTTSSGSALLQYTGGVCVCVGVVQ